MAPCQAPREIQSNSKKKAKTQSPVDKVSVGQTSQSLHQVHQGTHQVLKKIRPLASLGRNGICTNRPSPPLCAPSSISASVLGRLKNLWWSSNDFRYAKICYLGIRRVGCT
jgi:hypothetical protein